MNESLNPRFTRTARGYSADGRGDDPLADLARIVGSEDPFANLFDDARKANARPEAAAPAPEEAATHYGDVAQYGDAAYDEAGYEEAEDQDTDLFEAELRGAYDDGQNARYAGEPYAPGGYADEQDYDADADEAHDAAAENDRFVAMPPARESWRGDVRAPIRADRHADDEEDLLSSPYDAEDRRSGDADDDFDGAFDDETEEEPRKRSSLFAMAGAVVALAVVAGSGALAFKNGLFDSTTLTAPDKAPVIMASKEPAKIIPDKTVAAPAPAKEIFQKPAVREIKPEAVVSREEQPVAIPSVVKPTDAPKPSAAQPLPTRSVDLDTPTASAGKPIEAKPQSVATAPVLETPQPAIGSTAVEPRKVKTVKVLADGTIVTGEAQAPARPLPVPEDVAANEDPVDAPEEDTATGVPSLAVPQSAIHEVAGAAAKPTQVAMAETDADPTADVVDGADAAPAPVESVPANLAMPPVRPKNIPVASEAKPIETASVPAAPKPAAPKPAAAPKPVQVAAVDPAPVATAPAAAGGGSWVVQISSQKSQADANAAFAGMQRKFPSVLGGLSPSVKAADLGDRGTYYRVRVGSYASRDDATALCLKLKAAGGDCVVARF